MNRLFNSFVLSLSLVITGGVATIAQDDSSIAGEAPVAAETPAAEKPAAKEPSVLGIGSPAAPLNIEHWVSNANGKFEPVTDLEEGKVYVVEFWATWCGPCIKCMPHLAEIQKKYGDQNVQVISVSDEDLKTVETFMKRKYQSPETVKSSEETSEMTPGTYAELTSAYCVTVDPDESTHDAYFVAAGRRGIPSAFIVGKTGLIEWMGHPIRIEGPLESVVNDSWDREAFAKEYATEQKRDLMLSGITNMLRTRALGKAEEAINQAREEFADDALAMSKLDAMQAFVVTLPLYKSVDAGENTKALAQIEKLYPTVSEKVQRQFLALRTQLHLKESQFDKAVETLALIDSEEGFLAVELARITRIIFVQSKGKEDFPQDIIALGTKLCQKAVDQDDSNPYYLSTLARMQHAAGDLDTAIETQTKAVAKSDGRNKGYQVILDQFKAEKDSVEEAESK